MLSSTRSPTSFFSIDEADVALDLIVEDDDERLIFAFGCTREGESVVLLRDSSLIRPARVELNSLPRWPSSDGSHLTSIVSPFTDSALGLRLDSVTIAAVDCGDNSEEDVAEGENSSRNQI
jgi:hypothetical protein